MLKPETAKWMADIDAYCRELTGMGGSWCVFRYERIGKTKGATNLTHMRFTGNYLDEQMSILDDRKWSQDQTTERIVTVSCADFDAWVAAKTGEAVAC